MRTENLKHLPYLVSIFFILTTTASFAQIRASLIGGADIKQLEASLSKKELLQEVKDSLEVLKRHALATNNEILQVRCLYDLMRIRDMRTEDTLYFRNSAFMDTILNNPASSTKLKAQIYILQAQRLYRFNHRYLKFNPAAYRTNNLTSNYAALSVTQRDSLISRNLNLALKLDSFPGDATELLWLSSNPDVFLFTPTFADIILSEHVNLTANRYDDYYVESRQMTAWASLPSPDFRKLLDSLAKSSGQKAVFRAYMNWLDFRKDDMPANMFIESLVRKYMFLTTTADSTARDAYINYLEKTTRSQNSPFKAHAVYQLCLIWNEEGRGYVNFYDRYQFLTGNNFDKRYQYMPKKALDIYEQNKMLITRYPVLDKVLQLMAKQILSSGIKVEMQDKFIPGEAIPIKAIYKNADTLFYQIIADLRSYGNEPIPLSALLNSKPLVADKFLLPLPNDNNSHAVYLKISALPKGSYHLLISHKPIQTPSDSVYNVNFQVTSLTTINTDERVYVLDRKTGRPLPGARIRLFKNKLPTTEGFTTKVNHNGYAIIPQSKADSILIAYKNDTLGQAFNARINSIHDDDNIYDKDTYDDLNDFYDDKLKMHVFTDRAIYRPGQTVYYKIIFLTRDPRTGNTILFNRQNVGSNFFRNRLNKWIKDNQSLVKLSDPFSRKIDSARVVINEFGSFAGSFVLPKAAATGGWSIDGEPDVDYRNDGHFQVEEYKRPTIELGMEKQAKMLLPGQPFAIKLKLRSYTGAKLDNVSISYKLQRYGEIPDKKNIYGSYKEITLLDTNGRTDKNGFLIIPVNDSALAKYQFDRDHRYGYTYHISAKAIDPTGESSEIDERINISTQPVRIDINVAKTYNRNDIAPLNIKTTNEFEGSLGRPVNIKLYEVSDPEILPRKEVDQWYYSRSDWNGWFPQRAEPEKQPEKKHILILDTTINTGLYQKLTLPREKMGAGFYELNAVCINNEKLLGQTTYNFKLFDSDKGETPVEDIDYLPFNSVKPGETITWYSSGKQDAYTIYQVLYVADGKHKTIKNIYHELDEQKGVRKWKYQVPSNATGYLLLTRLSVHDNEVHQHQQRVFLFRPSSEPPEIIVERYRKVMAPGAKETFSVSVKTQNDNIAAELMTTMYDASLDKLEQHEWQLPDKEYERLYLQTEWNYGLSSTISVGTNGQLYPVTIADGRVGDKSEISQLLQGKAAGVTVTEASGLNEVVVVGYSSEKRKDLTGSVSTIYISGSASLQDYRQPLIVLDGVVYTGDLKSIAPSTITDAMVLKGADASAIYGVAGGQGVLIISTKGPIILPGSEEPVIKVRRNFNETAFFFPQIHISPDGYYHFSFTMPETATEWKWRLFAHTKDAQFAHLERNLQTQLNLMVQPNMPRLLYQGDRLKLKSRISNLHTTSVTGTITCKIENAVTGQDITRQLANVNTQSFNLGRKSTGAASFELKVPQGLTDPLKVVISITGGGASDAEEHIIPILSTRVFTRQSLPVRFGSNASLSISAITLPANSSLYGVGISIQQKPQASLINALPWLANYSYDCGEQTFNKLRAEVTAVRLMQKDSNVRRAFAKVSQTIGTEQPGTGKLPDELPGDSLPWLDLSNKVFKQHQQLYKLLDTPATKESINIRLERLYKLQQDDGGLSWFEGGKSSPYISAYVLAGFGQLKHQGWAPDQNHLIRYQDFISKLFKYDAKTIIATKVGGYDLFQLYALSYWSDLSDASLNAGVQSELNTGWADANKLDLNNQALLIINTSRLAKKDEILYRKALHQLENIRQQAITDAENGIRWKDVADGEDLETSSEETVALLNEAFGFDKKYKDISTGILQWLLTTKQDQHWQTTKATAAAIGILQEQKGNAFGEYQSFSGELGGKMLTVSNVLLDGTLDAFLRIPEQAAQVTLRQQGTNVKGAFTWYYFSDNNRLDTLNKATRISKKYFRNDKNKGWIELSYNTILKIGDEIRVKLTIETSTQLRYVHISDPRAAAFEPKENESGYHYGQGLSYYQSVRDTGLDLFTESIPRGISTIEYDLNVEMDGNFASGPVKLQCMYQPSVAAYSATQRFSVE